VAIKDIGAARESLGSTRYRDFVVVAVHCRTRLWRTRQIKVHVTCNEQIEMAIAIVVQKAAASAPAIRRPGHAGFFRNVAKRTVAIVVIKDIFSEVRDKKIIEAVVVVVANTARLTPSRMREPCLGGDVGKCSVAVVVKQKTGGTMIADGRIETGTVHEENIKPAVIVIVEEGNTATHLFEQELLVCGIARNIPGATQASGSGDIGEGNREWRFNG